MICVTIVDKLLINVDGPDVQEVLPTIVYNIMAHTGSRKCGVAREL
jgi:hypothetical protein